MALTDIISTLGQAAGRIAPGLQVLGSDRRNFDSNMRNYQNLQTQWDDDAAREEFAERLSEVADLPGLVEALRLSDKPSAVAAMLPKMFADEEKSRLEADTLAGLLEIAPGGYTGPQTLPALKLAIEQMRLDDTGEAKLIAAIEKQRQKEEAALLEFGRRKEIARIRAGLKAPSPSSIKEEIRVKAEAETAAESARVAASNAARIGAKSVREQVADEELRLRAMRTLDEATMLKHLTAFKTELEGLR